MLQTSRVLTRSKQEGHQQRSEPGRMSRQAVHKVVSQNTSCSPEKCSSCRTCIRMYSLIYRIAVCSCSKEFRIHLKILKEWESSRSVPSPGVKNELNAPAVSSSKSASMFSPISLVINLSTGLLFGGEYAARTVLAP